MRVNKEEWSRNSAARREKERWLWSCVASAVAGTGPLGREVKRDQGTGKSKTLGPLGRVPVDDEGRRWMIFLSSQRSSC